MLGDSDLHAYGHMEANGGPGWEGGRGELAAPALHDGPGEPQEKRPERVAHGDLARGACLEGGLLRGAGGGVGGHGEAPAGRMGWAPARACAHVCVRACVRA